MIKKKGKKTSKKKATRKRTSRKPVDAAKVREEIAGMVKSGAKDITEAVMDQAKHGQLAPAKYLFEVAGVYPPSTDGSLATSHEDSLAKTLLDRMNVPDHPVVADQEEEDVVLIRARDVSGEAERETNSEEGVGEQETVEG